MTNNKKNFCKKIRHHELSKHALNLVTLIPANCSRNNFQIYAQDLEVIGKVAFNRGFYDRAYEFMKAAEWRAGIDNNQMTLAASTKNTLKGKHGFLKHIWCA